MQNRKRFSKQNLMEELGAIADRLERENQFDPNNGTAQLKPDNVDRAVAYGRYKMIQFVRNFIGE